MDNTHKDKKFYEMADAYIALANEQSGDTDQGTVSATFLYAAARFNTFLVASTSGSADEFASRKEDVIEYFVTEYKKMLEEHFADYHDNFDKFIGTRKKNN
jgi:O-acetyl-ADP-ribose deacetylase (regulator of RNase III)